MNKNVERLYNGIIKENPTFVLMLGMCPTLAVTSSAINGLGMGLSTTVVLVLSNLLISAFRKAIPNGVRMPAYIVIVASLVTVVQFMMQAYTPSLSDSLGVYIPLIVVNCIILGRAESYASKNPVVPSIFDGLGMGLGFASGLPFASILALTIFIIATRQASTRNAPGAITKMVIGVNQLKERTCAPKICPAPSNSLVIVQDVECLQHVPVKNRNQQLLRKQSRRIDTDERINFNCSRICDCK